MGWIRLLLAISVILAHHAPLPVVGRMTGGVPSVQMFFILSGFYMALVLDTKYADHFEFYWNRFSRIFSGYYVALIFAIVVGLIYGFDPIGQAIKQGWDWTNIAVVAFINFLLVGSELSVFMYPGAQGVGFTTNYALHPVSFAEYMYMMPSWSLSVELGFYLLAPFILRSWKISTAVIVLSLAIRFGTYATFGLHDPWSYRFLPNELVFFAIGGLSYRLFKPLRNRIKPAHGYAALVLTIFCIAGFNQVSYFGYAFPFDPWQVGIYAVVTVCTPIILFSEAKVPLDKWTGEISYLVYLLHIIVLRHAEDAGLPIHSSTRVIIYTVLLAAILHPLAQRLDRWGRSARPRSKAQKERGVTSPRMT